MTACPATVKVHDDRWGAVVEHCDLPAGHEGDHRTGRNACEPVAYLGWPNDGEASR